MNNLTKSELNAVLAGLRALQMLATTPEDKATRVVGISLEQRRCLGEIATDGGVFLNPYTEIDALCERLNAETWDCPSCGRHYDGQPEKPWCPSDDCPSHHEDVGLPDPQAKMRLIFNYTEDGLQVPTLPPGLIVEVRDYTMDDGDLLTDEDGDQYAGSIHEGDSEREKREDE